MIQWIFINFLVGATAAADQDTGALFVSHSSKQQHAIQGGKNLG
jgi:hypothetical protein